MHDQHITQFIIENLDEHPLTPQQREHLADCPACQAVDSALTHFETMARASGMQPAPAGFVDRWRAQAKERLIHNQRRTIRQYWIFLVAANVASLLFLLLLALISGAPLKILTNSLLRVSSAIGAIEQTITSLTRFFAGLPAIVPFTIVLSCTLTFLVLLGLWLAAFWRYAMKGSANHA